MLAARPDNAQRFFVGGVAGLAVAWLCLAAGHTTDPFPLPLMLGVAAGMAACILFGFGLVAGVNKSRAVAYTMDRDFAIEASKDLQRGTFYGSLLMFAGVSLQTAHSIFRLPQLPQQWLIELLFLAFGLVVPMFAQVQYLKRVAQDGAGG